LEGDRRRQNPTKLRLQQSRLKEKVSIDNVDCNHHKSSKDQKFQILNILNLGFLKEHKEAISIGNPSTDEASAAKRIAYATCAANIRVFFATVIDIIAHFIVGEADTSLLENPTYYQSPLLLARHELGYLPLSQ
jgi:hypothetical protein